MADASPAASSSSGESSAQEKARLRRERRNAKIQAGGASRLQAITSLQGGSHRDVQDGARAQPTPSSPPPAAASGTATPDPEESDISLSQHHHAPAAQQRLPSPFAYNGASAPPFPGAGQGRDPSQDPMMALLQQMMGRGHESTQNASGPGQPGQPGDLPPGLANLLGAMRGGGNAQEPSPDQSSAWVWRIIHALFSLGLAVYVVLQTPFTGSKLSRSPPSPADEDWALDPSPAGVFQHFFYLFATFEVVLQSSRYFIEKGQLQGNGVLSSIAQMLPEPYAGYVRVAGRYSVIYSTVVSDAMVVVFVLGAASWWRGGVAA